MPYDIQPRVAARVGAETPVLLAALDPVVPLTDTAARRITGLGTVLDTFADQAGPIVDEVRRLAAARRVTPEQAARMADLVQQLELAEQACVTAIGRLLEAGTRPAKVRTGEHVDTTAAGLAAGIVTLDSGAAFKVTRFSDGTVAVTAVQNAGIGLAGSPLSVVDLGGGFTVEAGSTWRFQDDAEAARMIDALRRYVDRLQHPVLAGRGPVPAAAAAALIRPPRPPDLVIAQTGAEFSAGANTGDLVPGVQGGIAVDGNAKEIVTRDLTNGTSTSLWTAEGSLGLNGSIGHGIGVAADQKDTWATGRSVTRDAAGTIVRVSLTETTTGTDTTTVDVARPPEGEPGRHRASEGIHPKGGVSGDFSTSTAHVTTTTLEVNAGNRAVVQDWVDRGRPDYAGFGDGAKLHRPDTAVPGDAFQNVLHREAKVSEETYEDLSLKGGADVEVKAGIKLGVTVSDDGSSSRLVEASHLDAAGADGVRRSVPDPDRVP